MTELGRPGSCTARPGRPDEGDTEVNAVLKFEDKNIRDIIKCFDTDSKFFQLPVSFERLSKYLILKVKMAKKLFQILFVGSPEFSRAVGPFLSLREFKILQVVQRQENNYSRKL